MPTSVVSTCCVERQKSLLRWSKGGLQRS